jgi:REP element-mobilizing transposase RayT
MARKLRIQFPGALYHVINRGNYRREVFASVGAAQAFVATLGEACTHYDWRLHAYVVMPNHYHLALETPAANLVEGMHWLQGTYATRFNRFRSEQGHLFQGRYRAPLVENAAVLARIVHYINLNPVRARLVAPGSAAQFRWGSLSQFVAGPRPRWLVPDALLVAQSIADTPAGWRRYVAFLAALADDKRLQRELGFEGFCRGWAIGTLGWQRALAKEYAHLVLAPGYERAELREIKETRWRTELERLLVLNGASAAALLEDASVAPWKLDLAAELRRRTGAPYRWIAENLHITQLGSLRMQVHRRSLQVSP